jgi:PAS domain S-box-containing protein
MLETQRDMRAPGGASAHSSYAALKSAREVANGIGEGPSAWQRRRGLWPTALVLVAALIATYSVWRLVALDATRDAEREFEAVANNAVADLREAVNTYTQVLRGGAALFHSIDDVSRETWRTYVGTLEIEKRYPGLHGIGFAAALRPSEIAAHVAHIRSGGMPDYALRPEGIRPFHAPIVYLEPQDWSNRSALGYDMFSEPVRRAAMESARDAGEARLTGKVTLVQGDPGAVEGDGPAGVLLYWPLYQPGARLASVDDRRNSLRGWIYVPLRMDDFARRALGRTMVGDGVRFEINDGAAIADPARLYDSADVTQSSKRHPSQFSTTVPFDLFGRTWIVRASSLPAFERSVANSTPSVVLIAGGLVSLLLAAIAWTVNRRQIEATEAAERLEAELAGRRRAEEALRESEGRRVMVWMTDAEGRCTFRSKSWYDFTGQAAEAALGFGWADAVHPDDRDPATNKCRAANVRQEAFRQEYRLRRRDGNYLWAIESAVPNLASDGRFLGHIGSVVDVDERKRAEAANARVAAIVQAAHDAIVGVSLDGNSRRQIEASAAAERLKAEVAGLRRVEEALRESEWRLRHMADHAPVMLWMTDASGRCTFRSKSWYDFTGQTPEAAVGFGWADAVHPDDREEATRPFRAAHVPPEPFRQEYRLRRHDGDYRWAIDAATPSIAGDGRFLGYIGSIVDIDERKRAETANARIAAIVQAAHDTIVGVNLDGTIELWNAAAEQLLGYTAAEAIGRPVATLVPPDLSGEQRQLLDRVRQGAKIGPLETQWRRKDGTLVYVRLALAPILSPTGEATGISLALQDITERLRAEKALRENEARLRHIADASPSMLWSAAPDGTITWASESWFRYTGLSPESARDWIAFVHPDDRHRWIAAWAMAARDGSAFEMEVRKRRYDGQYRWFIKRAVPQRDALGRIVAWYGATTDIDDLKRAEQAARASEIRFRTVFNQQFQFMAILSPEGVVRACNETFFAATGVGREAVLGQYFWDTPWWKSLPEEQRWWQAAVESAVTSGQAITGEVALANADGSMCQAEFAVSGVRDEAGRVMDVIAEGRDITHRKQWEEQQNLLTKELAHRIKNSMAVIQSIARQTLRDAPKSFAEAFTGRIQSLAAAHDILLEKGWLSANLKDLARRQLAVVPGRIILAGPDVILSPILATSLGLVLHELVTNASKYGALSAPQGVVDLSWELMGNDGQRRVLLTWKERGGPRVTPPNREGFGSTLIERSLPGATVERRFEPEGLVCTIDLPLS